MADDGSTRTDHRDEGERPRRRLRRLLVRWRRNRLGLAALLPAFAMAAVFVAEPFAGMHAVDQPTPPLPSTSSQPAYPGSGR
jgi:hypothetical protein